MIISGLQKTTLLDYPGHLAATLFTGGCNFRCPYCHNSELLSGDSPDGMSEEEIFRFLKKRASVLEGVCITGGEPTLQPDLPSFIRRVRDLGFLVKLDTNGYRPEVLISLCESGLIDYAAMDIKSGPGGYAAAAGVSSLDFSRIRESISFLQKGTVPFEFRTTVVRGLHTADDFREIGPLIAGAPHYFLQSYQDSERVLCPGYSAFSAPELMEFADLIRPFVPSVQLRGIDL